MYDYFSLDGLNVANGRVPLEGGVDVLNPDPKLKPEEKPEEKKGAEESKLALD